ncbi:MAG: undecaprenyl/decaprenyl-phosphate alpha-N-acetylglucosaminyl 1-phosphate transferase [Spirochaetales bacterium]|nr:undecaprenyl/decaprenyl-phosphate alpha-N-acetylglucosaminyl 1-phosphate transferase [Spirochaetales bacterium]
MINLSLITAGIMSFIICMILIPVLILISNKFHWFDEIDARKIHTGNISRLAGVAIFYSMLIGLILSLFLLNRSSVQIDIPPYRIAAFIAAFFIIHMIGLIDDFRNIKPRYKFLIQIAAALLVMIPGRTFSLLHIPFLNMTLNIGPLGYILTAVWLIGACNAVNLIDGMDGLSGGITAIAALCLALTAVAMGNILTAIISFALFGSIIGFLVFNFPPAKIFMGDSGSLFIGFALASLPLFEINYHSDMTLIISVSILFIPVMDTLTSMLRRLRRGQSPFHPDREHLHHKLMDRHFSTNQILLTIYSVSCILCLSIVFWSFTGMVWIINGTITLWVVLILLSLMLEKHHAEKNENN